jgi:hypothetical protein
MKRFALRAAISSTARSRTVFVCAVALVASAAACKKEPTAAATPAPVAKQAAEPTGDHVTQAKAVIDDMAAAVTTMVGEMQAAGDAAAARQIKERFLAASEAVRVKGEELNKRLSDDERRYLETYSRDKLQPVTARLMEALAKGERAGLLPVEVAAPPAAVTPAAETLTPPALPVVPSPR